MDAKLTSLTSICVSFEYIYYFFSKLFLRDEQIGIFLTRDINQIYHSLISSGEILDFLR